MRMLLAVVAVGFLALLAHTLAGTSRNGTPATARSTTVATVIHDEARLAPAQALQALPSGPNLQSPAICASGDGEESLSDGQIRAATQAAAETRADRLWATGESAEQAGAYFLRGQAQQLHATQAYLDSRDNCREDAVCETGAKRELEQERERFLAPVIKHAMASTSADEYGLAYIQCHAQQFGDPPPVCAQLSASRWRQLAPDSLEAMVASTNEALLSNDEVGVTDGLAAMERFPGRLTVSLPRQETLGPGRCEGKCSLDDGLVATMLRSAVEVIAPENAIGMFCATGSATTADQRQLCLRLLERLVREQNSLGQLKASFRMAKALAWDADRTEQLRLQVKTINRVVTPGLVGSTISCSNLTQLGRIAQATLNGTEMAFYRRLTTQK